MVISVESQGKEIGLRTSRMELNRNTNISIIFLTFIEITPTKVINWEPPEKKGLVFRIKRRRAYGSDVGLGYKFEEIV